jgi:hypothetical protein
MDLDLLTPTPELPALSPRAQVAHDLAEFITQNHLNNPLGGTVTRSGDKRAYVVDFSKPANLDGSIRVYAPNFIMVNTLGRLAPNGGDDSRVFTSLELAEDFLRLAFIEYEQDKAVALPTKPPSTRTKKSA